MAVVLGLVANTATLASCINSIYLHLDILYRIHSIVTLDGANNIHYVQQKGAYFRSYYIKMMATIKTSGVTELSIETIFVMLRER